MFRLYHRCPQCAQPLETRRIPAPDGPERRVCAVCGFVYWNNSRPTSGGVVVDDAGRVLLGRRAIAPSLGLWDLPGGFLEPGEHPVDGLAREMREETGLEVEAQRLLGIYMDRYGDDPHEHTLNCFYLCRVVGGTLAPDDDIAELDWFAPDALPEDLAFQNVRDALRDWREARP